MKILITGSRGQLGSEFRYLSSTYNNFNWIFTDVDEFNLIHTKNIWTYLDNINPNIIINCAAYTNVDKAEIDRNLAELLNFHAVDSISKWVSKNNCKLIHISTDYVFDGNSSKPLNENAKTEPVNFYGKTKLSGENICTVNDPNSIIIRTSWLYSIYGNNFLKSIHKKMVTNKSVSVVCDQLGSPTYAADLADAIISIINYGNWIPGIYHFSNNGCVSWYEFTKSIKKFFGIKTVIKPISSIKYPTLAKRPSYSLLDKSKISKTYKINIIDYELSLKKCINILKK